MSGSDPKLTIRIIGRCNFCCPNCSTFSDGERPGLLSFEEYTRIIDFLSAEKFRGIINISGGETTLHPDLAAMISLASRNLPDAKIAVFTNGDWIGTPKWHSRLKELLQGRNVLVRFSLDEQHVEGKARSLKDRADNKDLEASKKNLFKKARDFITACIDEGAKPGTNFDFAFKGTEAEAKEYLNVLGEVPIYLIQFQKFPANRPKRMGFMAVDLDKEGYPKVYLTLGHIPAGEPMGGIEVLPDALKRHRQVLHDAAQDERRQ